jgi:hypothetical protein
LCWASQESGKCICRRASGRVGSPRARSSRSGRDSPTSGRAASKTLFESPLMNLCVSSAVRGYLGTMRPVWISSCSSEERISKLGFLS